MKKLIVGIAICLLLCVGSAWAGGDTYYIDIAPPGEKGYAMGFSGTSICQVISLDALKNIDGYFTFQLKYLTGVTSANGTFYSGSGNTTAMSPPVSGTTFSVHAKLSNVNKASAWVNAPKATIIDGINAFSGETDVGYDLKEKILPSGVTPMAYLRLEYESGMSAESGEGKGNLRPLGVLFVR